MPRNDYQNDEEYDDSSLDYNLYEDDYDEDYDEYEESMEEIKARAKRSSMKFASGMLDLLWALIGLGCIFLLFALLFSLYNWLKQDMFATFSVILQEF